MRRHYEPEKPYFLDVEKVDEIWASTARQSFWSSWEELACAVGCCLTTLQRGRGRHKSNQPSPIKFKFIEALADLFSRFYPCDVSDLILGDMPSSAPGTHVHAARLLAVEHLTGNPTLQIPDPHDWLKKFANPGVSTRAKRYLVLRQLAEFGGYFERNSIDGSYQRSPWDPCQTAYNVRKRIEHEKDRIRQIFSSECKLEFRLACGDRLAKLADTLIPLVYNVGLFHSQEIALHLIPFSHDRQPRSIMYTYLKEAWNVLFRQLDQLAIANQGSYERALYEYNIGLIGYHRRVAELLHNELDDHEPICDLLDLHANEVIEGIEKPSIHGADRLDGALAKT